MTIVKYNDNERELLARIMRAEALGDGNLGMLMVGNVIINRVLADCLTFKNTRTIRDVIYQKNQFTGTNSSLFVGRPTSKELDLADRVLKGEYYYPATNALWFYAPGSSSTCRSTWFNQANSGRYKNHCFYKPSQGVCPRLY